MKTTAASANGRPKTQSKPGSLRRTRQRAEMRAVGDPKASKCDGVTLLRTLKHSASNFTL